MGFAKDILARIKAILNAVAAISAPVSETACTATGTIVQDSAYGTGGHNNVNLPSGAGANTFGAWVQFDAAVSADSWISHLILGPTVPAEGAQGVIEIATGAALSEVPKMRFSYRVDMSTDVGYLGFWVIVLPIPIKIASGVRIAGRHSDNIAGVRTLAVGLSMYQGLET